MWGIRTSGVSRDGGCLRYREKNLRRVAVGDGPREPGNRFHPRCAEATPADGVAARMPWQRVYNPYRVARAAKHTPTLVSQCFVIIPLCCKFGAFAVAESLHELRPHNRS